MVGGRPGELVANTFFFQIFLLVSTLLLLWGVVGSSQAVHQVRYIPPTTPSDCGLPWESLELTTTDQVQISGWLIRHPKPKGVLILLHGFGTCKADLLDIAQAFYTHGSYHLLLIDFRGHGVSGGRFISFGRWEILDIESVLAFISSDPVLKGFPVGCYGVSMGGSIGILATARFTQIRAVVSDCAYSDLEKAIARAIWMSYHIPQIPLGQVVIWAIEVRLRCWVRHLSPLQHIGRIAPRGVMIIHGMQDKSVPPESAQALFKAAREPKRLWLIPEAEHVASFYRDPEEYLRQVLGFLDHALL